MIAVIRDAALWLGGAQTEGRSGRTCAVQGQASLPRMSRRLSGRPHTRRTRTDMPGDTPPSRGARRIRRRRCSSRSTVTPPVRSACTAAHRRSLLASLPAALTPAVAAPLWPLPATAAPRPPVGQHGRGHPARGLRRRHGRGAALGDLADPRARPHLRGERRCCAAASPTLNAALQRAEALLNLRDQRVVVWGSDHKKPELIGTLPVESRRAGRSRRLPRLRPLADAALGGGARPCGDGAARKVGRLRPRRRDHQRRAARGAGPQDRRSMSSCASCRCRKRSAAMPG